VAFKALKKLNITTDAPITGKHINLIQDNISHALDQLLGKDTLDQVLLKNVTLLPGIINPVSHGLGRKLEGYIVVRNHGGYAVLTDHQDSNQSQDLLLLLTTPALVTVDLLVF
jgi:hypothetical protein